MSIRKDVFDTMLAKLRSPLGDYASAAAAFATDAILAKFAVVELPEERKSGSYSECSIEGGDEIRIDHTWVDADQARAMAADLLRAADQIEAQS